MARRLTRKLIALVTALTLLLAFLVPPMSTQAYATTSQRTVKVGLFDTDTTSEAGNESGSVLFQKAYMQAIAEYANWKIEYVEAPWNKLIEMEKNGDIDVLMDVSMTEERTNYFNYSKEAMGTEMCYIFGNKDTKLGYDDFKDFDGLTLGYEKGSTIYTSVERYAEDNGFKLKGKPYKSGAAMFAALDAGKVDMVAQTNYYETPAGHVILARCYPEPVYVVTSKKHPSLQKELDSAMSQLLSYNAGFNVDMFELYFGSNSSKNVGFTKKERAYLEKKPTVYVYYETDWAPFEYDNNGEAGGITPDIIRAIGKETGIKFKFVLSASTQMVYKGVKENSKDTIMAVSYDYSWAAAHDLLVTEPYVTGSVMRVTKNENAEPKTVAVMKSGYLAHQVKKMYPKLKQVNYSNTEECMNAVRDGKADCTFINYYQTTYYRTSTKYQSFDYQPVSNITQNISLGVTKESNPLLLSILSKSLQRISSDEVQSILSENSAKNQGLSFGLLMRKYPMQMALGLGSLGILIGIIIFLIVSLGNRKRQNAEMEKAKLAAESANRAKSDFLSRMSHDIRTPLNGIIGMTYLANSQEHSTEVGEYLDKIDTSSKYLLSLINDILDMYRYYKRFKSSQNSGTYLMAWRQWDNGKRIYASGNDLSSASDGDIDIAYALLLADRQWGSSGAYDYKAAALNIIRDIYKYEVNKTSHTIQYGDWVKWEKHTSRNYTGTRSSDFIMAELRAFAAADTSHNWAKVVSGTYSAVKSMRCRYSKSTGLLPDFMYRKSGKFYPAKAYSKESALDGGYGYNACRDPWRIGTDYLISGSSSARAEMAVLNKWIIKKTSGDSSKIVAGYKLSGKKAANYSDLCFTAPFMVSAVCGTGSSQKWADELWNSVAAKGMTNYYNDTLKMLCMITAGDNWIKL